MMTTITTINQFLESFGEVSEKTIKILGVLTDASLSQEVAPGYRTLGQIGWHLVLTIPEMMNRTGLKIAVPKEEAVVPMTAKEILEAYQQVADHLVEAVKSGWTDETLLVQDDMYGETWSRAQTCACLIHHQLHHLGQMTVLMRQAGLQVPGTYGPSKEEWAQYGMTAPLL